MRYTKSGFPYVKTPYEYLHFLYRKQTFGHSQIGVHCGEDKNHGLLHDITWVLINDKYITYNIIHEKDSLFVVRLTMIGVEYVEGRISERRRHRATVASIITSSIAATFAIIGSILSYYVM